MTPKEIITKLEVDLKAHFPNLDQRNFETIEDYTSINSEEKKLSNIYRGLFIVDNETKYWCYAIGIEEEFNHYGMLLNRIIFKMQEAINGQT